MSRYVPEFFSAAASDIPEIPAPTTRTRRTRDTSTSLSEGYHTRDARAARHTQRVPSPSLFEAVIASAFRFEEYLYLGGLDLRCGLVDGANTAKAFRCRSASYSCGRRDGYPVGVAPEIAERMLGPAEGAFGVDYPIGTEQSRSMVANAAGAARSSKPPWKPSLPAVPGCEERGAKPRTYDAGPVDGASNSASGLLRSRSNALM
jgi:hypothetical protein